MENKIIEIQEYFKNKIVSGDYEIKTIKSHTVIVTVDGIYDFHLWMGNGAEYCEPTIILSDYFMAMPKFDLSEKTALFALLEKPFLDYKKNVLLLEKKAEYERLKAELGEE